MSSLSQWIDHSNQMMDFIVNTIPWIIGLFVLLSVGIPLLRIYLKCRIRRSQKQACTVPTIGFVRSVERTGLTINDNPQMLISLDVLEENGTVFQSYLTQIIPLHLLSRLTGASVLPLLYNPKDRTRVVFDSRPDANRVQALLDRYACAKHPGITSYEERREISRSGTAKKALLENLRLTGKEENGEMEAEVSIRITNNETGDITAKRTMYVSDRMLNYLIIGRHVNVRVVPGKKSLFAFLVEPELFS